MVIYLSKHFFKLNHFSSFEMKKQMIFAFLGTESREGKLPNFKRSSKSFTQDTKAISN